MTLMMATTTWSNVIRVPGDQYPIQAGIDAATAGDTVLTASGTYIGEGNKNLDFGGKNLVLLSESGAESTIIDCQYFGRGFYFHSGETAQAQVIGFMIINGAEMTGGGILIENSSPTFSNCIIHSCLSYSKGGGVAMTQGAPSFINCDVHGNHAVEGGGISAEYSDILVNSCIIAANSSSG
ncbi:MAG: right-handed parallel beta-helix repeat-containing protein [bacterium]|nr:right-handed parallel beta-helix repeat-containing protein [bacterium]